MLGTRPGLGEPREKTGEFGPVGVAEVGESGTHRVASLAAKPADQRFPGLGQRDPGASRVRRIRLTPHQSVIGELLHEARCARLIDADRGGGLADGEGGGC